MKVYRSKNRITSERARLVARSVVETCWDGVRLDVPLEWSLACDDHRMWFVCRIPGRASFDATHIGGTFVEGLWEHDVAELFLMDAEGRYQEFNVSPTGAWWSCGFSAYRARATPSPVPGEVLVEARLDTEAWEVVFSVPLRDLSIPLNKVVGVHISAISRSPYTRYLSSSPVVGATPDFHRRECFGSVEWIDLQVDRVST